MAESKKYIYAIWRRKESTARIKLYPNGDGNITIKRKDDDDISMEDYFGGNKYLYKDAMYPFQVLDNGIEEKVDIDIVVESGGIRGQAEAIRLGFARALTEVNPDFRTKLKPYGLLKRDPRAKERKKPGLRKARKSPQWSKR